MKKTLLAIVAVVAIAALPAMAGQYHSGTTLLCADCHTMHFSMQHNWDGTTPVPTAPTGGAFPGTSNWLSTSGPNSYLLKAPANQLCLQCHNGQTYAPDVYGANTNAAAYTQGREAGAVNDSTAPDGYETYMGHTLGSTANPPGFDPTVVGLSATWYTPANGLECISCHAQHGPAAAYRNLGAYALGGTAASFRPTYVLGGTNDATKDVWINNVATTYQGGSGNPSTFGPYYDFANVSFNRNDATVGTTKTSNKIDTFCASCHGDFHGGPGDTNIGASAAALDGFIRHPTAQVTIGVSGGQGYGGHSSLSRYVANTTKVHVYSSTSGAGYTDASPGCVTCHKAHGNQNPFGLFFLNGNAPSVSEQGGWLATQTVGDAAQGLRNLCGQCHGQGN